MSDVITLQEFYRRAGVEDAEELRFAAYISLSKVPWDHQVSGLNLALADERFGLYDDPGCGKTLPAQAWLLYYAHWGNKCVVIMPPTLLDQFHESLVGDYQGLQDWFSWHLLDEPPKKRAKLYAQWDKEGWPSILMMSYQMFLKVHRDLMKRKYCVILADEAHALKNVSSKIHEAVYRTVGGARRGNGALLQLTGTPNVNTLMDTYGMTHTLDNTIYGTKKNFEQLHCVYVKRGKFLDLVGFKNKDLLHKNLYKHARRVIKEDVFDLHEPIITEVPVKLHPQHKTLYEKLVKERMLEVDGELIDALTAQSLRQKCLRIVSCPEQFIDSDKAINNTLLDTADTLLDSIAVKVQEKCIIFCFFRDTVEMLADYYSNLNPAVIYGKVQGRQRRETQRKKFLHDDTCRVLIANVESAGVGLNLQDVCRYVMFYEPHSVPGKFQQAVERVYRAGQKKVVSVWVLKAVGTTSVKITRDMLRKAGDIVEVNHDRTSIFKELMGED